MAFSLEDLQGELTRRENHPWNLPRAEQVNPDLRSKFENMAQDFYQQTGVPLRVTDSFRSNEEQADVYRRKPNLAAKPGHSRHEHGEALDIDQEQIEKYGVDKWNKLVANHGFIQPALKSKGETWHIELPRFEKAGKIAAKAFTLDDLKVELARREGGEAQPAYTIADLKAELQKRVAGPEAAMATGAAMGKVMMAPPKVNVPTKPGQHPLEALEQQVRATGEMPPPQAPPSISGETIPEFTPRPAVTPKPFQPTGVVPPESASIPDPRLTPGATEHPTGRISPEAMPQPGPIPFQQLPPEIQASERQASERAAMILPPPPKGMPPYSKAEQLAHRVEPEPGMVEQENVPYMAGAVASMGIQPLIKEGVLPALKAMGRSVIPFAAMDVGGQAVAEKMQDSPLYLRMPLELAGGILAAVMTERGLRVTSPTTIRQTVGGGKPVPVPPELFDSEIKSRLSQGFKYQDALNDVATKYGSSLDELLAHAGTKEYQKAAGIPGAIADIKVQPQEPSTGKEETFIGKQEPKITPEKPPVTAPKPAGEAVEAKPTQVPKEAPVEPAPPKGLGEEGFTSRAVGEVYQQPDGSYKIEGSENKFYRKLDADKAAKVIKHYRELSGEEGFLDLGPIIRLTEKAIVDPINAIKSAILPSGKSPEHLAAAELVGGELGGMFRNAETAFNNLRGDRRWLDRLGIHDTDIPLEDNIGVKFMSDMSQGRTIGGRLGPVAEKIQSEFGKRLQQLEDAGVPIENVRENYFPGMWTKEARQAFNQAMDEATAKGIGNLEDVNNWTEFQRDWVKTRVKDLMQNGQGSDKDALQYLTKRPLKGKESFRKPKVFDDIMTGVEFGLEPISRSPIDIALLKMREMDQSIMANKVFQKLAAKGDLVNVDNSGRPLAGRTPDGKKLPPLNRGEWAKIEDDVHFKSYGEIWRRDPDSHELIKVGERWAKIPAAEVLKNYLSQGLYTHPLSKHFYGPLMSVGNLLNQSQLGWGSLFHAGFTGMETQISAGANVLKDMYGVLRGNRSMGQLGETVIKFPTAFVRTPMMGNKVMQEWVAPSMQVSTSTPVNQLPTTAGGRTATIAKAAELAGARFTMDQGLRTHQLDKMVRDWYGGNKVKAAFRSPVAATELTMKPVMALVPRQKAGVFGELVGRIMEQNPTKTLEELTPQLRQAWNRVDARLGQVVYDRLFMDNIAKNTIQAAIRSPGWTGGTIAEVGGAPKDIGKFLTEWAKTGKLPADIPDRVAYTISLLGTTFTANSALTWAFTGDGPSKQTGMDLWAFRDGTMDKYGNPNRWLLPTYAKDIFAYWENWQRTVQNKMHPVISGALELKRGYDYYNEMFRDPNDPVPKQMFDTVWHGVKMFEPFWTRGARKAGEEQGGVIDTLKKSPGKIVAPEFGVMPATRAYTATPFMKSMDQYFETQGRRILSPKQAEAKQKRQELDKLAVAGKKEEFETGVSKLRETEAMSKVQEKNLRKKIDNRKSFIFEQVRDIDQAIKTWDVASPEEKVAVADVMNKKVANLYKHNRSKYREIEPQITKVSDELTAIFQKQMNEEKRKKPKTYKPGDPEIYEATP